MTASHFHRKSPKKGGLHRRTQGILPSGCLQDFILELKTPGWVVHGPVWADGDDQLWDLDRFDCVGVCGCAAEGKSPLAHSGCSVYLDEDRTIAW